MNFDRVLIIDWSANNSPKTGADSIWIADADRRRPEPRLLNPSTREEAMVAVRDVITEVLDKGERLFAGFDFAFGYPAGSHALPGKGEWEPLWKWLGEHVCDDAQNASNRFEIGSRLNNRFGTAGPFWGHPWQHAGRYGNLGARRPDYEQLSVSETRHIDRMISGAQPVWKLAYTGSVGSQTLLGIARLQKLRESALGDHIAIWPFETKFADDLSKSIIIAELYPSLFDIDRRSGEIKDEAQVRTVAECFLDAVQAGRFEDLLDGPRHQPRGVREQALTHEAWMAGFTDDVVRAVQ